MNAFMDRLRAMSRPKRFLLLALIGVLVMTVAEVITDTSDLTSRGTAGATLRLAIPILLAGLGGLYSERAGVVNIGLEGMMIAGTWFAAWGSFTYGPWRGVLLGFAGGALFGLLHAIATVTFKVDHIVSGVAINILGLGAMRFLSSIVYNADTGGSVFQSPPVQNIGTFSVPLIASGPDWLGSLELREIFFVSDVAGLLRGITGDVSWLTLLAFLLVPFTAWLLWKTAWGLRLRSCGEDPWAAESLGVAVLRMKYFAVVISGALAGLAGAFLVLVQAGIYRQGMTGGRGFIGLGALIFGNWMPGGVLGGSLVFGFGDALRFRGSAVVRSLVLVVAMALILMGLYAMSRSKVRTAVIQGSIGLVFLGFYWQVTQVPDQVLTATPYLITLFVLAGASQHLRMPAADGARYAKGEAR